MSEETLIISALSGYMDNIKQIAEVCDSLYQFVYKKELYYIQIWELRENKHQERLVKLFQYLQSCNSPYLARPTKMLGKLIPKTQQKYGFLLYEAPQCCILYTIYNKLPYDLKAFTLQVAGGIAELHDKGFVHRQLSHTAVWVYKNGERDCYKLGNLYLTRVLTKTDKNPQAAMMSIMPQSENQAYASPEQERLGPYTSKCDIWAFGCLAHYLVTGSLPFQMMSRVKKVDEDKTALFKNLNVDPRYQKIILSCLSVDPQLRPTAREIISSANEI